MSHERCSLIRLVITWDTCANIRLGRGAVLLQDIVRVSSIKPALYDFLI